MNEHAFRFQNHACLGDGLNIFSEAMRDILNERLKARFGRQWLEKAVLPALSDRLRTDLEQVMAKDQLSHLEAKHFVRIVARHFDGALVGVFTEGGFRDYKKINSSLLTIESARDEWAHPRTGDMRAEDVANKLYTMAQLLAGAKHPLAASIERLRQDMLAPTGNEPRDAHLKLELAHEAIEPYMDSHQSETKSGSAPVESNRPLKGNSEGGSFQPISSQSGTLWTVQQFLALLSNPSLNDADLATELGRTRGAVGVVRAFVHSFHRGGKIVLSKMMVDTLKRSNGKFVCAICGSGF